MDKQNEVEKIKQLGEKIRQARVIAKLSQEDLGKILNFPGNVVSRIELGQREVRASELQIIVRATNKPIEFFLEDESPVLVATNHKHNPKYAGLKDSQKKIIDNLIEEFGKENIDN